MPRLSRRTALAFVAGALLVGAVLGGRAAYAALGDDVITACFKPSNGTLYLVGDGSRRADCQPGDRPISWNAQGPAGQPGVGVTSVALTPGADPNCPLGGSKFTSVSGVTYACNGGFSAESRSPNGAFRIRLNDTGIARDRSDGSMSRRPGSRWTPRRRSRSGARSSISTPSPRWTSTRVRNSRSTRRSSRSAAAGAACSARPT